MAVARDGSLMCTSSLDKTLKIFDITGFGMSYDKTVVPTWQDLSDRTHRDRPARPDMINMLSLPFVPGVCEWVNQKSTGKPLVAVANAEGPEIYLYSINPEMENEFPKPKHIVRHHSAPGALTFY